MSRGMGRQGKFVRESCTKSDYAQVLGCRSPIWFTSGFHPGRGEKRPMRKMPKKGVRRILGGDISFFCFRRFGLMTSDAYLFRRKCSRFRADRGWVCSSRIRPEGVRYAWQSLSSTERKLQMMPYRRFFELTWTVDLLASLPAPEFT